MTGGIGKSQENNLYPIDPGSTAHGPAATTTLSGSDIVKGQKGLGEAATASDKEVKGGAIAKKMGGLAAKTVGGAALVAFSALISAPGYFVAGLFFMISGLKQVQDREIDKQKGLTPSKTTGSQVFLKGTKFGGKLLAGLSTLGIAPFLNWAGKSLLKDAGWK